MVVFFLHTSFAVVKRPYLLFFSSRTVYFTIFAAVSLHQGIPFVLFCFWIDPEGDSTVFPPPFFPVWCVRAWFNNGQQHQVVPCGRSSRPSWPPLPPGRATFPPPPVTRFFFQDFRLLSLFLPPPPCCFFFLRGGWSVYSSKSTQQDFAIWPPLVFPFGRCVSGTGFFPPFSCQSYSMGKPSFFLVLSSSPLSISTSVQSRISDWPVLRDEYFKLLC